MVPCAGPVFEERHVFLRVCVRFFRDETALQLLKIAIRHGEIYCLAGRRLLPLLQERLEDLAILRRLTA